MFDKNEIAAAGRKSTLQAVEHHTLRDGESAWSICNVHGIGMGELQRLNKGVSLDRLKSGQSLRVPSLGVVYNQRQEPSKGGIGPEAVGTVSAQKALIHASAVGETPKNGLVAVKVVFFLIHYEGLL